MSYGEDRPDTWSDCSNEDFKEWFKTKGYPCFANGDERVSCGPDQPVKVKLVSHSDLLFKCVCILISKGYKLQSMYEWLTTPTWSCFVQG